MHVLITLARFTVGGTETYTLTVAEQLERLGHEVTIYAGETSESGEALAASRQFLLRSGPTPPLDGIDVVLSQDGASAALVADGRPDLRQVFVCHGLTPYERLPSLLRPTPPVVVMNDRIGRHVAAGAASPEVVRLRQPIDLTRFKPSGPTGAAAPRVLALGNYLDNERGRMLASVCEAVGFTLVRYGATSKTTLTPEVLIAEADIVIGYGRVVLEALAMGRAAYVWDYKGGDGWVTPQTYDEMEANGFDGSASSVVVDARRLREDLAAYLPELGVVGPDLVAPNHAVTTHVAGLVKLFAAGLSPAPVDGLQAMAVAVRTEARAAERAFGLDLELRRVVVEREELRTRALEGQSMVEQERGRAERAEEESAGQRMRAEEAAEEAAHQRGRAELAETQLSELLGSTSWRLTKPLRNLRRPTH